MVDVVLSLGLPAKEVNLDNAVAWEVFGKSYFKRMICTLRNDTQIVVRVLEHAGLAACLSLVFVVQRFPRQ
jgi:hypothetical protein